MNSKARHRPIGFQFERSSKCNIGPWDGRDLLTGRHMDEAEVVRWAAKAFEKEVGDSDYFVHSAFSEI